MAIHVTAHACERFVERIAPTLTLAEAAAEIERHSRAIECAAKFGCSRVKLGNGATAVLRGHDVVTVVLSKPVWARADGHHPLLTAECERPTSALIGGQS